MKLEDIQDGFSSSVEECALTGIYTLKFKDTIDQGVETPNNLLAKSDAEKFIEFSSDQLKINTENSFYLDDSNSFQILVETNTTSSVKGRRVVNITYEIIEAPVFEFTLPVVEPEPETDPEPEDELETGDSSESEENSSSEDSEGSEDGDESSEKKDSSKKENPK